MSVAATQNIASPIAANRLGARSVASPRAEDTRPSPSVSLSSSLRGRVDGTQSASAAVDDLLASSGAEIFGSIKSLRRYPENLAGQLDNDRLSDVDRTAIANRMSERENAALGMARSTFDPATYAKAYIEFYDTLSPEEQNSDRYRGTREQAVAAYQWSSADAGEPAEDLSGAQDPILMLFDKIKTMGFKIDDEKRFIERMREAAAPLLYSPVNGERFTQDLEKGLAQFTEIQSLIGAARGGEPSALQGLQALTGQGFKA